MKFKIKGNKFILIYKLKDFDNISNEGQQIFIEIKKKMRENLQKKVFLNTSEIKKEVKVFYTSHRVGDYINIYIELNTTIVTDDKTLFTLDIDNKKYELFKIYDYRDIVFLNKSNLISSHLFLVLSICENLDENSTECDIEEALLKTNSELEDEVVKLFLTVKSMYQLLQYRKNNK